MKNIVKRLFLYFEGRRPLFYISLSLLSLLLITAITRIRFSEDISKFLPADDSDKEVMQAFQRFTSSNRVMVYFSMKDSLQEPDFQLLEQSAEDFATALRREDTLSLTSGIFLKSDMDKALGIMDFILDNLPYYLTDEDYSRLDTILLDPRRMEEIFESNLSMMYTQMSGFMSQVIVKDPLRLSAPILNKLNELRPTEGDHMHNGYLLDKEGRSVMVPISSLTPSSETRQNKLWLSAVERAAQTVMQKNDVVIDYIGPAVISIGNAEQIKWDTIWTTVLALTLIVALLFAFYKDWRAILLILFSIGFGILFALAFLALFKDDVSVIAVGIGSIIVGIAVNYPLHFLAHIKDGHTRSEAMNDIVDPLVTGNVTTVGAFLSLLFISSDAMRDMGLFAAFLLVGTILFVIFALPHLFTQSLFKGQTKGTLMFGKIASFQLEKNRVVVAVILLLTVPLCYYSFKPTFETNMGAINYMTPEQRSRMAKLSEEAESGFSKSFCLVKGETLDEALRSYGSVHKEMDSLKKGGYISKLSGISVFFPSLHEREERAARWNEYWKRHNAAQEEINRIASHKGFSREAFAPFCALMEKNFEPVEESHFDLLMDNIGQNYIMEDQGKWYIYTILECGIDKTSFVVDRLGSQENVTFLDGKSMLDRLIDSLSDDFNRVLYICGCIVFFFLLISFGRGELALISFVPLTVAWIWILGLMGFFDMKFNIVNVILATFIFGQGDDYTIFVTEGLMHEHAYGKKVLASYKNSVMLSALIMFIGIGVLIFAKHPAMRSLAEVTIVGMFSVILMAYFFPPLLFNWLTKSKGEHRLMPITLRNLLLTILSFLVFFVGTIYMSLLGFFVLTIGGKSDSHKRFYHKRLCGIFKFLVKLMPGVDCHVDNQLGEKFDNPGIIVCNHQSHLDLLYTLILSPKIVCLTNRWVWNCPFYGWIIRYADFLPVSDGLEQHEAELKAAIDKGYSILIFPEGTRSADCSILRFHKGAFHLAEKFGVDIIPIMIHGIGHFFPKKEFLLRKGRVDVKILPRITSDHPFRKEVKSLKSAQLVQHYYEKEYDALAKEIETPDYFKDLVYHNYIYKGREVELRAKETLSTMDAMKVRIAALPDEGEVRLEEMGQGEFSLLAALTKKRLTIISEMGDEERYLLAKNCASVPQNLRYELMK